MNAGPIAGSAEFFSFGTNDLTQMTWGFSRDDVEAAFFSKYIELGIFGVSPFETIDRDGVGRLVDIAVKEGRAARPDLHIGVCGEHGGDPDSVHFFHQVGLDYVSCSPFRVPVARLEAGRAALARRWLRQQVTTKYDESATARWVAEPPKRAGRGDFERDRARVLHSAGAAPAGRQDPGGHGRLGRLPPHQADPLARMRADRAGDRPRDRLRPRSGRHRLPRARHRPQPVRPQRRVRPRRTGRGHAAGSRATPSPSGCSPGSSRRSPGRA